MNILKHNSIEKETKFWYLYLIAAALMLVFAVLDYFYYKFYPIEAGIFIDSSGRNREDLVKFKQI